MRSEQKDKVTISLNQVFEMSEPEKHVLDLKLLDVADDSSKDPPTSMSRRSNFALHWIKTHYVEDKDICVPKQDIYEQYRQYCETSGNNPISSFYFGKMMKLVFPNIHDRRLGQRGKSKYCYGGLRRKDDIDSSNNTPEVPSSVRTKEDLNLYALSCQLVCEWAAQLLGRPFADIRNLSEYLVSKGLSCGKTAAKFTLLSGSTSPPKLFDKDRKSPNSKHHDRQMLLQRRLQHNELIREHREKLKQQQEQLREQCSASAGSSFHLADYPLKDEPITTLLPRVLGTKIQPRSLSVQPYVWSVSSNCMKTQLEEANLLIRELGFGRPAVSELSAAAGGEKAAQTVFASHGPAVNVANSAEPTLSVDAKNSLTASLPAKRCHSTSVVEKQSSSLLFGMMELTGRELAKHLSSTDTNLGCEMDYGKTSNLSLPRGRSCMPVDIQIISSCEGMPKGLSQTAAVCAERNLTKMLESPASPTSSVSLLMPQHPKRYGDNISPDRSSLTKRKCTTSLGVTKQQSLEASMIGNENQDSSLPRLRPYSCPVSVDVSRFEESEILSNNFLAETVGENKQDALVEKLKSKVVSRSTVSSPSLISESRKNDETRQTRPEQKEPATPCHFVQKPTVINRPKHILHSITSCPDLKQIVTFGEVSDQYHESSLEKQSYNILNTLLSSTYDILSDSITSVKNQPTPSLSSPLTSPYLNSHTASTVSNPSLQSSQLRLMTNTSHTVEAPSIRSSLSSRSAFVPVTSHKLQVSSSALKETENEGVLSPQKSSTSLIKSKDQETVVPTTTNNPEGVESQNTESYHMLIKPSISHPIISESLGTPAHNEYNIIKSGTQVASMKFKEYGITITSHSSSSSSSSSSSTLCRSGESMSSGCESVLTTPVPAPVLEKSDDASHVSSSTLPMQNSVAATTSGSPTCHLMIQNKSLPSSGCKVPAMSPHVCSGSRSFHTHTTTPITPPKRASRNRFTPIRPKLGGGTNTPSPQKLGGMSITSPQKKDLRPEVRPNMRPVSVILKEQRVKCAQDLLVNLAKTYQGEVKLQMPAEFLGLSPVGTSKSTDVHVTIKSPSSSLNILQHQNLQPGSSDLNQQLWSLTSPTPSHKEITVIVEPISQSVSHSNNSPAMSASHKSATPVQLLQSLPPAVNVQILTQNLCSSTLISEPLVSPNAAIQGHSHTSPLALSPAGSGTQVIILPPSSSYHNSGHPVDNSSKQIIVEDDKGNKYSLDQRSVSTVLPHNLHHIFQGKSGDSIAPSNSDNLYFSSTSGLLNVSEIKGHVVGPDANGQTYLLVPNSEPVKSATTAPDFLCQQMSPVLPTTLAASVARNQISVQPGMSCASGFVQPHATSSSALLSELSHLASSVSQNISGQTLIQHNSGSSAFHKCPSSINRRTDNIDVSVEADRNGGNGKNLLPGQSYEQSEKNFPKDISVTEASGSSKNSQACDEISRDSPDAARCHGMKRKASKSQVDEHEDRKRLNSSRGDLKEEDDDDVFIVKIEDNLVSKAANENTDIVYTTAKSSLHNPHLSKCITAAKLDQPLCHLHTVTTEETKDDLEKIKTDTETLLGMIEDSKSMTVKETIRALNKLRARQNQIVNRSFSAAGLDDPALREIPTLKEALSCQELNVTSQVGVCKSEDQLFGNRPDLKNVAICRSQSAQCTSFSRYPFSDVHAAHQERAACSKMDVSKLESTGRRHISLNLESLESDALLDTELTLDQRLVGDIRGVALATSDQKTSVGIAVKSARSTGFLLSDRNTDLKNRSKQHKQDIGASLITLLHDKKDLNKGFKCAAQRESVSYSLHDGIGYQDIAFQECVKQDSKCHQNSSLNNTGIKPQHVTGQRRSVSCVRDILQCGAKRDFIKYISAIGDKPTADSECQSVKTLPLSNINQSSLSGGSKASEHPLLAQCLSVPSRSMLEIMGDSNTNQTTTDSCPVYNSRDTFAEQNDVKVANSKFNLLENELPGDIADFITESMSAGNSNGCDAFKGHSLTSLLADLKRNVQNEKEQVCSSDGQSVTVWRSISVPNTIPDSCCDFKSRRNEHDISSKNDPLPCTRRQSVLETGNVSYMVEPPTKHVSSSTQSSLPLHLSWENLTDSHVSVDLHLNPEHLKEKDLFIEHPFQSSDGGVPLTSGTFLSPIGPAKLTRRSSIERSSSGERTMAKAPVDGLPNKCSTERSLPRIRTPTDRSMTKIPVDRSLTKTPVDRSLTKTPVDRSLTKTPVDRSLTKTPVDRSLTKTPVDRSLTKTPVDRSLSETHVDKSHTRTPVDRSLTKTPVDRSLTKTPVDRSVTKTPVDRSLTETPVDRSITKTPVDRFFSMTPIDITSRKISRGKSPSKIDNPCGDHTTAAFHQHTRDREYKTHSGNRVRTKSPLEKVLSNLVYEGLFIQKSLDGLTHQGLVDGTNGDRSFNQTPVSDAGYSSVSQTPISDVGYSSVSPSPVMMSAPGLYGECGRQELTSPGTIFMPLRSDSVMSGINNCRSNDGVDGGGFLRTGPQGRFAPDITQCLNMSSEEDHEKEESFLAQDVIDGTLVDHEVVKGNRHRVIKKTSESSGIKDTLSFLDFERFMSVQLNCIPTPPCSPSTSPQHSADTSQSPLSFNATSSHSLTPPHSQQNWIASSSSISSHQMTQFSSVTTSSSHDTCLPSNSLHIISSSPGFVSCAGQHSPNVLPAIASSPYGISHHCSSPHQYNPHPSPPFTPSSQRCLASPRCPTPCSHRSPMSPCCAVTCSDSNSAPNRFMPIQTSGILTTSLAATQTYIRPIRPVVTLASMANPAATLASITNRVVTQPNIDQNTSLDFSLSGRHHARMPFHKTSLKHMELSASNMMFQGNHDQNSTTSDAPNIDVPSLPDRLRISMKRKEDDSYNQRKGRSLQKVYEDRKSESSSHPALILSLTGSIGSVSGQGMQEGWRKDLTGPVSPSLVKKGHNSTASSHPSRHAQYWKSRLDKSSTSTVLTQTSGQQRETSQTDRESVLLLDGDISSPYPVSITENLTLSVDTSHETSREASHKHALDLLGVDDLTRINDYEKAHKQILFNRSLDTPSQVNESVTSSQHVEKEQLFSQNVNNSLADNSDFPFSLQLARISDQSRFGSKEQQCQEDSKSYSRTSSQPSFQKSVKDKFSTQTTRTSSLSAMLQAPAFTSTQTLQSRSNCFNTGHVRSSQFHYVSDLPTAYYSGTAPNIDLTKASFALTSLASNTSSQPSTSIQQSRSDADLETYLTNLSLQLGRQLGCVSGNQDDLDETLNVLKNLDSQYFQHDEDSNSPETSC